MLFITYLYKIPLYEGMYMGRCVALSWEFGVASVGYKERKGMSSFGIINHQTSAILRFFTSRNQVKCIFQLRIPQIK